MLTQQLNNIKAEICIFLGRFLLITGAYCCSTIMFVL